MYYKELLSGYIIQNSKKEHVVGLEALQRNVYPKLSERELFTSNLYLKHIDVFPEGQFVVLDGTKVIGMTTTIRYQFSEKRHTFLEISGGGDISTHNPKGDYLYGLDLGVHPDYRGKGIAKAIYRARQELVRNVNLKGQVIVGMLNGFYSYADKMSIEEYYKKVAQNKIIDPTVSIQKKIGFKMKELAKGYLTDPTCGNSGALLILESNTII